MAVKVKALLSSTIVVITATLSAQSGMEQRLPDLDQRKRVALVIGNSNHKEALALRNPRNDAKAVAAKLADLEFEVIIALDATRSSMVSELRKFSKLISEDRTEAALLFFAGYAAKIDCGIYMLPIDFQEGESVFLKHEAIKLEYILDDMTDNADSSIVLMDTSLPQLGGCQGNIITSTGNNWLFSSATAPGRAAFDGDKNNSPYTEALLEHIGTPDLTLETMLTRVRKEVVLATDRRQVPWVNSTLTTEFYFNRATTR